MNDGRKPSTTRTPTCGGHRDMNSVMVNTGFFYARATENVRKVMSRALEILDRGHSALDGTDQGALNLAMQEVPAAELSRRLIDCYEAQNGWRYFGPSNISTRRLAIVVHANWMIGESTKRACLQAAGLWFVSDQDAHEQGSGIQCRSTLSFPQAFFSKTMASGEVRDCRPLV
mmetsp:Transcript_45535/g.104432  ORF Transcript_45535/g.104432 Transcript_45535/m.104432 type:complete len:173 (+) Transcript_45535:20-538(+)